MARTPQPPATYARITSRLYGALLHKPAAAGLTSALLSRIADVVLDAAEPQVTATEPEARLHQALAALRDEGLAYEATIDDKGRAVLTRQDCRWSRLVGDPQDGIEQEQRLLSALLAIEPAQIERDGVNFVYRLAESPVRD